MFAGDKTQAFNDKSQVSTCLNAVFFEAFGPLSLREVYILELYNTQSFYSLVFDWHLRKVA